jgi:methyl-accepting chemotaxis protein
MYVNDFIEVLNVMRNFGDGNFNANVRKYHDSWAWANDIMDSLRENFKHITNEISVITKNAAKGEFHITASEGSAKGEWAELIKTLNEFLSDINEPLDKIEENVILMSQGDFSRLEGKFYGVFESLQTACNLTNERSEHTIDEIAGILKQLADGDLTIKNHKNIIYTPIREALDIIITSLHGSISEIYHTADIMLTSSEKLARDAVVLSDGSKMQASAIEELHDTIGIISGEANDNDERAGKANLLSSKTDEYAHTGDEYLRELLISVEEIKDSSASISNVVGVIENIAFQTNLLALNASVEAARAGEHGKSFSVVAEEVRSLASRSQKAVSETSNLIADSIDKVDNGLKNVQIMDDSLAQIITDVSQISDMLSQISQSSLEQKESLMSVLGRLDEISDVVKSNSGASDDCASVSQEFSSQAKLLKEMISIYRV